MKRTLHLLLIDPQNDFCDVPADYLMTDPVSRQIVTPALPVAGAHADMLRIAELIERAGTGLSDISITLDSHHRYDIAHPPFWMDASGKAIAPFTVISAQDVREGRYLPRQSQSLARTLAYMDSLETNGRYQLMVWPVHCEIGSWGHNVHADVRAAYGHWEEAGSSVAMKLIKGSNPWTEHYSAVMAEVPDPQDPATQLNRSFIDSLAGADQIYIAGEAGSHCVKATTEHIVEHFDPAQLSKLVLLSDGISPVAGFEAQYASFLHDMQQRGVQIATAADVLPDLVANQAR
ncbi:cysteine hydrolase [Undibacterium sp. FT79W]|uniref:cysteine hydrolase n=1 Tax=Undibacterium sp. FT79W TaxID=2762296 RepID=UPI00164B405D|nr:cysteine hydrolase [Undibacterium sp. FT79W]MBC3877281.1 cysteine hydrolase [Undibacterium sp. FT79W]